MAETITNPQGESGQTTKVSPMLVALAWLVVIVPAAWGITQTLKTSMQLFKHAPAAATTHPA